MRNRLCLPLLVFTLFIWAPRSLTALSDTPFVESRRTPGALALVEAGRPAELLVDGDDWPGVLRAARDLRDDFERVTGQLPALRESTEAIGRELVVIGTIGRSRLIDELIREGKIDVGETAGRWEGYLIQSVASPWPGVERALVIAGSDRRGTIYGIYELSEQIGVSPWYWWADVPARESEALYVPEGTRITDAPAIRYRGIFINDEAPALSGWAAEKFGGFNHRMYGHVFELILRLRGNYLWPAMWRPRAFIDDDPENARLADDYGIVIGTSHHEPMMRAHDEWGRYGDGPWDYSRNAEKLKQFWRGGVERVKSADKIVTLGMRGDGDEAMSEDTNIALLEKVVADQREILSEVLDRPLPEIPQVWALYKEVQGYYEKGMRVPDDVTLLWADDNWGNIRRLPAPDERERTGGAGVYYHFDYVGGPRNYKWMNVTPITKVWEQMHLAREYGADRIWIVNVGDLKPMEFPIEFFLTYAWNPERWPYERLEEYSKTWATREFGEEFAAEIASLINGYSKLNRQRTPELLTPETFSPIHYNEAEGVIGEWR
ncbi:MAG: glycosyl hydrolase 115 family protein, partial [Opitutaceae bacterium]